MIGPISRMEAKVLRLAGYLENEIDIKESLLEILKMPPCLEFFRKYEVKELAYQYVDQPDYYNYACAVCYYIQGLEQDQETLPDILQDLPGRSN